MNKISSLVLVTVCGLVLLGAGCKKSAEGTDQKAGRKGVVETTSVQSFDNGKLSFSYPGSWKLQNNSDSKSIRLNLTNVDAWAYIEILGFPEGQAPQVTSTGFNLVRQCLVYDPEKNVCIKGSPGGFATEKIKDMIVTYKSNAPDNSEMEKSNIKVFQQISKSLKVK